MTGEAALNALVERFLDRTLPADDWTHEAHLKVGLMLARRLPREALLPTLRQSISAYNLAVGGRNTAEAGYHETITAFYADVLCAFARATQALPAEVACARLLASPLARREAVLSAYDPQTLKGAQARLGYRPPDRADFDPARWVAEALAHD
jgi:hypothetical protein